jgi:hypothetical protein
MRSDREAAAKYATAMLAQCAGPEGAVWLPLITDLVRLVLFVTHFVR